MNCSFCNKEKGIFKLKSGKVCCQPYPAQCPSVRAKNSLKTSQRLKKEYQENKRISFFKIYNDGHNWLNRHHSEKTKQILSLKLKNKKMDEKFKEKRRIEMNLRYKGGWEASPGRTKKYDYESPIAGKIKVDGKWELSVCIFLDKNKFKWIRNKKRFKYIDNNGKNRTYCPDFYIIDEQKYIEVKGFITELDLIKWSQFPKKLEVWDKNVLINKNILGELQER